MNHEQVPPSAETVANALRYFRCARFTFVMEAITPICFREFCGATLRGGLGLVLKRLVCQWPPGICTECRLRHACAYGYMFETGPPPDATRLRRLDHIPRPYVVDPIGSLVMNDGHIRSVAPRATFMPGDFFQFDIVLVGRAIPYITFLIVALDQLGRCGTGRSRGRFRVRAVFAPGSDGPVCIVQDGQWIRDDFLSAPFQQRQSDDNGRHWPPGALLCVEFLSPTRITNRGRVQEIVQFHHLIRALLRRISSLCYFHCGYEFNVNFRDLIERSQQVTLVNSRLYWVQQKRISGRQRQPIFADGVVGQAVYSLDDKQWQEFEPLLTAGTLIHVGKTCVMGAGKFSYQPVMYRHQ